MMELYSADENVQRINLPLGKRTGRRLTLD
jgi:hypothetical protein